MKRLISSVTTLLFSAAALAQPLPEIELIRSDETIQVVSGDPVTKQILSPVIQNSDGITAAGPMTVEFSLSSGAANSYIVSGVTVGPGETINFTHNFSDTGGKLAMDVAVSGAGAVSADDYSVGVKFPGEVYWGLRSNDSNYKPMAAHFTSDSTITFLMVSKTEFEFFEVKMDVAGNILSHQHYVVPGSPESYQITTEPTYWWKAAFIGETANGSTYTFMRPYTTSNGNYPKTIGIVDTAFISGSTLEMRMATANAGAYGSKVTDAETGAGAGCQGLFFYTCYWATGRSGGEVKSASTGSIDTYVADGLFSWSDDQVTRLTPLGSAVTGALAYNTSDVMDFHQGTVIGNILVSPIRTSVDGRWGGGAAAVNVDTGEAYKYTMTVPDGSDMTFWRAAIPGASAISDSGVAYLPTRSGEVMIFTVAGGRITKAMRTQRFHYGSGGMGATTGPFHLGESAMSQGRLLISHDGGGIAMVNVATEAYFDEVTLSESPLPLATDPHQSSELVTSFTPNSLPLSRAVDGSATPLPASSVTVF